MHVEGSVIRAGNELLTAIETPGHGGRRGYRWRDAVFTGDTLFIGGCGRGFSGRRCRRTLRRSIVQRLFTLPEGTRVPLATTTTGIAASTIGEERRDNPRLAGKTRDEFIALMGALNLPKPTLIDAAVPPIA